MRQRQEEQANDQGFFVLIFVSVLFGLAMLLGGLPKLGERSRPDRFPPGVIHAD